MLICFERELDAGLLDRRPFKFRHKLMGHPALSLKSLEQSIPELPPERVKYSSGLLKNGDHFEEAYRTHRNGLSLEATIEMIRTSDSYIMVREPEIHPTFKELHRELIDDVATLLRQAGLGATPVRPRLYLFIASPNAFTPFHIDRNSTLLMQFQGSKEIAVFPSWDERVVRAVDQEDYVGYAPQPLPWRQESDSLAHKFRFTPGDALHIPFVAGHYVQNDPEDVSVSLSIIFNTPRTETQLRAMGFNRHLRAPMARVGLEPYPVGKAFWRDQLKSSLVRAKSGVTRMLLGQ